MATVTGLTAARMLAIEGASIVDGEIVSGDLILTKHDGSDINAGSVAGPEGPTGPAGPAGGLIPGEVRLWPGATLPLLATYGLWTWANGGVHLISDYPIADGHIDDAWRTFGGASDPGVLNFRVPDLRGLVPAGLDQMPAGARANRMTRSVAITLAGKTGEETHVITIPEMPVHGHPINWGSAYALITVGTSAGHNGGGGDGVATTGPVAGNTGGGTAHENVQPTVMVPYIVKLDD